MRFTLLSVENLGVFRGKHTFDLTPNLEPDEHRNAIVFTGHNGAGKTMLFTALQLALHGPLALGDRVSRDEYSDYLFHRLHRYYSDGQTIVSNHGSATVRLEYHRSGQVSLVEISRRWQRRGNHVEESIGIALDGNAPDIAVDDAQSWINDFVAPSLLPVCFLDAEQLSVMSDPQQYEKLLAKNLRRLLGLDLAERLDADLAQYVRRESSGSDADALEGQRKHLEFERGRLTERLDALREQESATMQEIDNLLGAIVAAERELAAEGGAFAARRERTLQDAAQLRTKISEIEKHLAELAGELLPFALAPTLLQRMANRLRHEGVVRQEGAAAAAVDARIRGTIEAVQRPTFWDGIRVSTTTRERLCERLLNALRPPGTEIRGPDQFLHDVGESSREKLIAWTEEIRRRCVPTATSSARELQQLKSGLRLAENELASVPAEDAIRPFHARIAELQKTLSEMERARTIVHTEIGAAEFRLAEQTREQTKLLAEIESMTRNDVRFELARKSRLALRAFQDAALRDGLRQFERDFVEEFNALCHKEALLNAVVVDPDTFRIRFEAAAGHVLRLANFSAGERQLVALASLWALRCIAKRSLPLAIDTPLGRLDAVHRDSVLRDYLPIVADQVLLFATDAEIDVTRDDEFAATVARVYRLSFDPELQQTKIELDERTPSRRDKRRRGVATA